MKEQFLLSFPCMVSDRVAVGHYATFIDVAFVLTVILHSGWLRAFLLSSQKLPSAGRS
jgi:heme exporter protein D